MKKIALITAFSAAFAAVLNAQTTATTDPVGFVTVSVPANSDATIAVPLNRTSEFKGTIASIAGNVITVSGTPAWTTNQFVYNGTTQLKTYAVQVASGTKEGMIGKITANTTNTITVQLDSGDDFTGVATGASGDQIDILPYWTPSTLFSSPPPIGFALNGFETGEAGVNFGSSEIYEHLGGNAWDDLILGQSGTNTPLRFGSALIARNSSASPVTITLVGSVPMTACRIRLSTRQGGVAQDQYVGFMSPVPEPLASATSANALNFPAQVGDIIQGFNNATTGFNKGAEEIYQWNGSAWDDLINGVAVSPNLESLKPGYGYIYQKAATASPSSVVWVKAPKYLQ